MVDDPAVNLIVQTRYDVETPEQIELSYGLAGPGISPESTTDFCI